MDSLSVLVPLLVSHWVVVRFWGRSNIYAIAVGVFVGKLLTALVIS